MVGTSNPTKSLRYFSGKTDLPPELCVPWSAFYDRVAANVTVRAKQSALTLSSRPRHSGTSLIRTSNIYDGTSTVAGVSDRQ